MSEAEMTHISLTCYANQKVDFTRCCSSSSSHKILENTFIFKGLIENFLLRDLQVLNKSYSLCAIQTPSILVYMWNLGMYFLIASA